MNSGRNRLIRLAAGMCLLSMFTWAQAGLILSPLGGITIFSEGDDEVIQVQLDQTYGFYGDSFDSIYVSTNGNLNFTGSTAFAGVAFPSASAGAMIAPLWDDLTLFQNSRIIEQQGDGYFAITWNGMSTWFDLDQKHTFQVLMFNKSVEIGGFEFLSGDIAFAYGPMGTQLNFDDQATVGLNNTDGTKSTGLPGSDQTVISSDEIGGLYPYKSEFILFRWDGLDYVSSHQTTNGAVPEPSSLLALALGAFGLASRWSKRSR